MYSGSGYKQVKRYVHTAPTARTRLGANNLLPTFVLISHNRRHCLISFIYTQDLDRTSVLAYELYDTCDVLGVKGNYLKVTHQA